MRQLDEAGALHFTGFTLPKTQAGLKRWASALPLEPCADPLTAVGVRKLLCPKTDDGVYEAVNAEALSKTYIGLHNDVTYKLAAPYAAFACFQRARRGGEFLVCDGRAVLANVSPDVLTPLQQRNILERPKAPVNRHPASGAPTFFSSLHSQARHLQTKRAAIFSDSSVSSVAATDAFYGDDLSPIPPAHLDHLDEVINGLTTPVAMAEGDVVLLDSYQVLHGRDTFDGPREHGVIWLAHPEPK